ncbi:MAG: outer membrane protein [Beijerinckiaceae bacterium]
MGGLRAIMLSGVFSAGLAGAAQAADLLPPPPPVDAPAVVAPDADFSGWYIRGDVGIGAHRSVGLRSTPDPLTQGGAGFVPTSYNILPAMVSGTPYVGLGFGYKFNNWIRADFTSEYRTSTFSSQDQLLFNNGAAAPNTQFYALRNSYRGNLSASVFLFNAYLDLGTWAGITPFVGAGVGLARTTLSGVQDNGYNNLYAGPGSPATANTSGNYKTSTTNSLAWALMAGAAYDVNSRLKLELGYRYLNVGKVKSAVPDCNAFGPGLQPCNIALEMKRSGTHEIRVGLRWMLAEPAFAPPPPAPIVRKY